MEVEYLLTNSRIMKIFSNGIGSGGRLKQDCSTIGENFQNNGCIFGFGDPNLTYYGHGSGFGSATGSGGHFGKGDGKGIPSSGSGNGLGKGHGRGV
jgi:hypothetical protein